MADELISRQAAKDAARYACENGYCGAVIASPIFNALNAVPAVDAVPVVRCKDCEKWRNMTNDPQYKVCWCGEWNTTTRYDAFCSYGKRRKENG